MKFIPKKYKYKHKILELLWTIPNERFNSHQHFSIKEISENLAQKEDYIKKLVEELEVKNELLFLQRGNKKDVISNPGTEGSYKSNKYLIEGWDKFKSNLEYWIKNFTILIGTLIAISTFVQNVSSTKKNSEDIQKVILEQQQLKYRLQSYQDSLRNLKHFRQTLDYSKKKS